MGNQFQSARRGFQPDAAVGGSQEIRLRKCGSLRDATIVFDGLIRCQQEDIAVADWAPDNRCRTGRRTVRRPGRPVGAHDDWAPSRSARDWAGRRTPRAWRRRCGSWATGCAGCAPLGPAGTAPWRTPSRTASFPPSTCNTRAGSWLLASLLYQN